MRNGARTGGGELKRGGSSQPGTHRHDSVILQAPCFRASARDFNVWMGFNPIQGLLVTPWFSGAGFRFLNGRAVDCTSQSQYVHTIGLGRAFHTYSVYSQRFFPDLLPDSLAYGIWLVNEPRRVTGIARTCWNRSRQTGSYSSTFETAPKTVTGLMAPRTKKSALIPSCAGDF